MRGERWYLTAWWSFRYGLCGTVRNVWDCHVWWHRYRRGYGYSVCPWYATVAWWLIGLPCFALQQASGHWCIANNPTMRWVGFLVLRLSDLPVVRRLGWWIEGTATHYCWLPPDGAEHGVTVPAGMREVGCWQRRDLVSQDPTQRLRIYVAVTDEFGNHMEPTS